MYRISITTRSRIDLQDIASKIQELVKSTDIESGVCHVFVPHTTGRDYTE